MRWIWIIISWLFLEIYAFQAVQVAWINHQNILWWISMSFFGILLLLAFIFLSLLILRIDIGFSKAFNSRFQAIVFLGLFAKFVMLLFVLLDDLRRGAIFLYALLPTEQVMQFERSELISGVGFLAGTTLFVTLLYGLVRNPYRYQLHHQQISFPDLPNNWQPLKIVQISDIHSGSFLKKDPIWKAIKLINQQNPDLVFFTGDLVNNRAEEIEEYLDVFSDIKAKYGVFSVLGNHDYGDYIPWPSAEAKIENLKRLKEYHHQMGWSLLLNTHQIVARGTHKIAVIGVENYSAKLRFPKYGNLQASLDGCPEVDLKLLLSHDPSHWKHEVTKVYQDIDITFSGHTHGMQFGIEISGIFKWSPIQYIYKEWAGIYRENNQYLNVNRGFGHLGYPGRVGILPEITILEIIKEKVE